MVGLEIKLLIFIVNQKNLKNKNRAPVVRRLERLCDQGLSRGIGGRLPLPGLSARAEYVGSAN